MHFATQSPERNEAIAVAPWVVVQNQLNAYNARDVEAILATYAADAEQFEHPATRVAAGAAELRARFTVRFSDPILHARLNQRIVMGDLVVDHETVTRTFEDGPGMMELIAMYQVRDGRIARAWFIPGPRRPRPVAAAPAGGPLVAVRKA